MFLSACVCERCVCDTYVISKHLVNVFNTLPCIYRCFWYSLTKLYTNYGTIEETKWNNAAVASADYWFYIIWVCEDLQIQWKIHNFPLVFYYLCVLMGYILYSSPLTMRSSYKIESIVKIDFLVSTANSYIHTKKDREHGKERLDQ